MRSELGCERELAGLTDLIEQGTGARRQLDWFAEHGDVTRADARDRRRQRAVTVTRSGSIPNQNQAREYEYRIKSLAIHGLEVRK